MEQKLPIGGISGKLHLLASSIEDQDSVPFLSSVISLSKDGLEYIGEFAAVLGRLFLSCGTENQSIQMYAFWQGAG